MRSLFRRRLCFAVHFLRVDLRISNPLRGWGCSLFSTNNLGMSVLIPLESKQLFSQVNIPLSLSLSRYLSIFLFHYHTHPYGIFWKLEFARVCETVSTKPSENIWMLLKGQFAQYTYFSAYPSWHLSMQRLCFECQAFEISVPWDFFCCSNPMQRNRSFIVRLEVLKDDIWKPPELSGNLEVTQDHLQTPPSTTPAGSPQKDCWQMLFSMFVQGR